MGKPYDVIVIGGGASGMMAAGRAAERGRRVLLLEKNAALGAKLAITGGGRCNILNAEEDVHALLKRYGPAEQFLRSPFSQFGMRETYDFFESNGVPLKVEERKRAFPKSDKAADVVRSLEEYMMRGDVHVIVRTSVRGVRASDAHIDGVVVDGRVLSAQSYIIATGGLSHPETGSTGDGFKWLASLDLPVVRPTPTLVPLRASAAWVANLAGVSLRDAKVTFFCDGRRAFKTRGPLLFTHFGLSGPTIMNAAGKVADLLQDGDVTAAIDLFPDLDLGILEKKMIEVFDANKNKTLRNVFKDIAPAGTAGALLSTAHGIDIDMKVHSVTKEMRRTLALILKESATPVTGLMGFDRAIVADGGLPLTEVDTKTMRVRAYDNLYVTGDLLHITRPSGGYSLQLAWTSGYVAGSNA